MQQRRFRTDLPLCLALGILAVFLLAPRQSLAQATPAAQIQTLEGFEVELLYSVPKEEQGSWVSLAIDPRGRLITSDQYGSLYRITPPPIGSDEETRVERLEIEIGSAHGLLCAFDSLYVVVNGRSHGHGSGLYRVRDTDEDDQYDSIERLKAFRGGGEHGPHAVILTEDGKGLYVIGGNHTDVPEGLEVGGVPHVWSEDLLLPRQWDARGHARGKLAPGGWVCRTDPAGESWTLISNGYRNEYDIALNRHGELFTFDADMEWDMGTPWYRPTRVNHAVSGSEFGWRSGTGKWPEYYPDSLPPVLNIGPGSPTGALFGTGAKFPTKYQDAFYILDWTFGTMYAVHLKPSGASYTATKEEFLSARPLPLTDGVIGHDGAMYFTIGGRRTQSGLYRVRYTGDASTEPPSHIDPVAAKARALRHELESYHRPRDGAVNLAWPFLASEDRFIRYAARIAVEHQPVETWQERALAETRPAAIIEAMVALARHGDSGLRARALETLGRLEFAALSTAQKLAGLRALALVFIRLGEPTTEEAAAVIARLDPHYPAKSDLVNRELARILVYLDAPSVVTKTLALMSDTDRPSGGSDVQSLVARNPGYGRTIQAMLANQPNRQNLHYAFVLRNVRYGWTLEQRRQYFEWFQDAAKAKGGASFQGFLNNIRAEALENCSEAERRALADLTGEKIEGGQGLPEELPKPEGPGREWTLDELVSLAENALHGRDFDNGKRAFLAAKCASCHRFDGLGGALGPDLTNLVSRFSPRDVIESLVEPNKVISDQYGSSQITTTEGERIVGRIIGDEGDKLTIVADPDNPEKTTVLNRSDVLLLEPSKQSLMPADLLKPLNREEVLDLLAYLLSRGDQNAAVFR